jgi:ribosomal protein S18 acetylase RimI-like enzyme
MKKVVLRPSAEADRAFLKQVYASTRADELALLAWTDEQKAGFIAHQFEAQDAHYRNHYDDAAFDVIEVDGEPAGRLYVHRGPSEIRIVDIALAPAFRGRGLGTRLLRALIAEAEDGGRKLSIHVEVNNPARRLYERLGFRRAGEYGVYLLMERLPLGEHRLVPVGRDRDEEDLQRA